MIVLLISYRSRNTDDPHHPGFLVIGDMAVEHPVARVVGDEGDFDDLAGRNQCRIAPLATSSRFSVTADDAEAVPMPMHRVPPRGLISQDQDAALPAL